MPFYVGNVMSKSAECRPRAGNIDTSFAAFNTGLYEDRPEDIKIQPDGKILVFGNANVVNGVTQNNMCRLNTDGTVDNTFNTGANPGSSAVIYSGAIQPDGKIVIGGAFTTLRGVTRNGVGRLNPDGSLDTTFNNASQGTVGVSRGSSATVYSVEIQPDGKILLGGNFTTARGVTQNGLARLNTDGTLDTTFNTGANPGTNTGSLGAAEINVFKVLSDGKILAGGQFTTMRGVTQNRIAKLNTDGSLDTTFNTGANPGSTSGSIVDMVVQDDGKIVLVGQIANYGGVTGLADILRINADGSRDTTWPSGGTGVGGELFSCTKQYDNKIVVTGYFTSFKGVTQNGIARLNSDGTLDTTFNTGGTVGLYRTDGSGNIPYAYASALQDDCKIIVGGWFSQARGVTVGNLTRLM